MEVEVPVVSDCPNEQLAVERLRQALDAAGLGVGVTTRVITGQAEG